MIINQNLLCRCYIERSVSGISGCEGVINTHHTIKLSDYYGGGGYYWVGLFLAYTPIIMDVVSKPIIITNCMGGESMSITGIIHIRC